MVVVEHTEKSTQLAGIRWLWRILASNLAATGWMPSPLIRYPQYVTSGRINKHFAEQSFTPAVESLVSMVSRLAR